MSGSAGTRLYELLPAVYRLRDADRGEQLRAFLGVIEAELELLESDVSGLYENWFIETCAEWVVPYLGDLLDVRNLLPVEGGGFSQRAYVANTLAYRRRKGTALVVEQLARDITGWPAKAVEFFELLGATQYANHIRLGKAGTVDLRDTDRLELVGGPFDPTAHTVDVRHIDNGRGRYNIPNVGLFLWRLQDYPIERGATRALATPPDGRGTFHPLGLDAPLFNQPQTETEITQAAEEFNLPCPLRRRPLYAELEARRADRVAGRTPETRYFGRQPVLSVFLDGAELPLEPEEVLICNLADWRRPAATTFTRPDSTTFRTRVAVDPVLGRLAVLDGSSSGVEVGYAYGFSGDLGGGPYDRRSRVAADGEVTAVDTVAEPAALGTRIGVPSDHATLETALQAWRDGGSAPAVIEIEDDATHALPPSGLTVDMTGRKLVIQAANGRRPALIGDLVVTGGDAETGLVLDGLLIGGDLDLRGTLGGLDVRHCTFASLGSADPRLTVQAPNDHLELTIEHSIVGSLRLSPQLVALTVRDSILTAEVAVAAADDETKPGPPTTIERATVFGTVTVRELVLASEAIFDRTVLAERHQTGCVRFSYVPAGSKTPRRYRCQPDLALATRAQDLGLRSADGLLAADVSAIRARVHPAFTSRRYGHPAFGQLARGCALEIRTGAEDGSEMGAFSFLKQPQREANLRSALDEYLRWGLEAGVLFAT